jgi:hypothetical protein
MGTIMMTATTDAPLARRLIEEHITEPRMRSQAMDMVENAARGGFPLPTTSVRSPVTGVAVPTGVMVAPNGMIGATQIVTSGPGLPPSFSMGPSPVPRLAPLPPANDAPANTAR